jgi:uncharacterized protein
MKVLWLLLVVLVLVWWWRAKRRVAPNATRQAKPPPQSKSQDMVACAFCGVHVPTADALTGARGVYCCADHQRQAEA